MDGPYLLTNIRDVSSIKLNNKRADTQSKKKEINY